MLMLFPTLFGAAVVVFLLLRLIPGDVCMLKFGGEGGYADPEQIKQCQELLGILASEFPLDCFQAAV